MHNTTRTGLVLGGISLLGIVTHALPHDMGVSTVGAVSMLAAAYLPGRLLLLPVLATVIAVVILYGSYGLLAMGFVYLAHLCAAGALYALLRSVRPTTVAIAAIVNAIVFYLLSNLTPMAMGFYPPTVDGWITCYINGLPFLLKGIAANLAFGGLFFFIIGFAGERVAHRIATSQRH